MRQLLVLAAIAGLAAARPETYREKEDFQFSRSSTDEGTKSGYYGAQRGNMGGNYEKAHNMDALAQNQMGGLVRTVEGELGDGAKQHTGSVYTAANSRGIYGSGTYDLKNLEGRNFQEGISYDDSQSHSSLTSHQGSAYKSQHSSSNTARYSNAQIQNAGFDSTQSHNGGYASTLSHNAGNRAYYGNSNSRGSGYNNGYNGGYSAANSDQSLYSSSNHQALNNLQSASQYEDRNTASHNSRYYSQAAGYQGQVYDQGSESHTSDRTNVKSRLLGGSPVRIVIRPGTQVTVPVAAQTYDASQSGTSFDQNAINSETEVLNGHSQHVVLKPVAKNYESSYSYRKEWEKHDTKPVSGVVPLAIPTHNSYPVNSELYEDAQASTSEQQQRISGMASQSHHSSHSGYNVNAASSNQHSQHQNVGSNTGTKTYHGAYNGATGTSNQGSSGSYIGSTNGASSLNLVDDGNPKPKGYQSSYSYHKSWERQGDPYVIIPSTNGDYRETSGKLTAGSQNQGEYGNSHQYGSQSHHHTHQGYNYDADCDENGHSRKARSYNSFQHAQPEEMGQQVQVQQQWENLGQQTPNQWDQLQDAGQQIQKQSDKLEDFGQQTPNTWEQFSQDGQQIQQQSGLEKFDKLEELGQHAQNHWDHYDGEQTQNTWDNLELESQTPTDLGQKTQDVWTGQEPYPSDNNERQTKPALDASGHHFNGMNFNQQSDTFEITDSSNRDNPNIESHTIERENTNKTHHVHTIWDEIKKEEIGQENEDTVEDLLQTADLGQQTQETWDNINQNEKSSNSWHQKTVDTLYTPHHALTNLEPNDQDKLFVKPNSHPWMYNQVYHHHQQNNGSNTNQYFAHSSSSSSTSHSGSQSHSMDAFSFNMNNDHNSNGQTHSSGSTSGSSIMSLWDKLGNIEKDTMPSHETHHNSFSNLFVEQSQQNENEAGEYTNNTLVRNADDNVFGIQSTNIRAGRNNKSQNNPTSAILTTEAINIADKSSSSNIGRGDIDPENSYEQSKPDNLKDLQAPEKIESIDITKERNKLHNPIVGQNNKNEDESLSVMSLDQQKSKQDEGKLGKSNLKPKVTSTTQKNNYQHMYHDEGEESYHQGQQIEMQNQKHNNEHASSNQFDDGQNIEQQKNSDQQFVNFGQQSEDFAFNQMDSTNTGHSVSFHQGKVENLDQQNKQFNQASLSESKPNENLNQKSNKGDENLEQSDSGWEENMEDQQVQTAWKPDLDLQQQSRQTEPVEELSPQNEQFDQVSLSSWKPDESSSKHKHQGARGESIQQPNQTGWMENMEDQQVQTAWKPDQDLQQQSQQTEPIKELSQQNEQFDQASLSSWKPNESSSQHKHQGEGRENIQQPSQIGWMESMEDQQVQTARKPDQDLQEKSQQTEQIKQLNLSRGTPESFYVNWGQGGENLDQQSQSGWMENMGDQQVETTRKSTEDLQQQSHLTDKFTESMENPNQHVQTAWKRTELQSKHTDNLSQMQHNVPSSSHYKHAEVAEELIVPKKIATVDSPPEVEVTEKPGFWKSLGDKFSNAKDKVSKWF